MSTQPYVQDEEPDVGDGLEVRQGIDLVTPVKNVLLEVGEPLELLRHSIVSVVRRPVGFWSETLNYAFFFVRRAMGPALLANVAYSGIAITFSSAILLFLGAANRVGVPYFVFSIREIVPLFSGTVVAGVIGASITAEIGARKIRGELDAMRVMGQDPVRDLVLPRMIATAVMSALLGVLILYFNLAVGVLTSERIAHTSTGAYVDTTLSNIFVGDVFGIVGKMLICGVFVSLVCASKGLNTPPGSEGLGWAVNRAVVICTLAVWVIDVLFNMVLQGLAPSLSVST